MKPTALKRFTDFVGENLSREEEIRLRDMGLAPTRWFASLMIDYFQASQNSPEYIKEVFDDWIDDSFSDGPYRIDKSTVEMDNWNQSDFEDPETGELIYDMAPSVSFVLETQSDDLNEVSDWIEDNMIGRIFECINDLQIIEAD